VNSNVVLRNFDVLGKRVKTLVNEKQRAGTYKVNWDGTSESGGRVSSGTYFYQLQINNKVVTKKAVLVK